MLSACRPGSGARQRCRAKGPARSSSDTRSSARSAISSRLLASANLYEATFLPNRTTARQFESSVGLLARKSVMQRLRRRRGICDTGRSAPGQPARNASPADRFQVRAERISEFLRQRAEQQSMVRVTATIVAACVAASCKQRGRFPDVNRFVGITFIDTINSPSIRQRLSICQAARVATMVPAGHRRCPAMAGLRDQNRLPRCLRGVAGQFGLAPDRRDQLPF